LRRLVEDTDEPPDKNGPNRDNPSAVKVFKAVAPNTNMIKVGLTVKQDSLLLPKGTVIGPPQISALAAIGRKTVKVIRRPRIAIVSTGDELIKASETLRPGKTYDCNSAALAALVTHYGGVPTVLGIARDNEKSLVAKIARAETFDALITSGGASKGDYDLIRRVIARVGELMFARINVGPGASMAFGLLNINAGQGRIPMFALAGPPEGCLINAEMFVRSAIKKMMGMPDVSHPVLHAVSQDTVLGIRPKAFVRWSRLKENGAGYTVELKLRELVGPLPAVVAANCLAILPPGSEVHKGDMVSVLPLDWQFRGAVNA
jgi:molybdopterin molybdotransferase